MTGLLPFALFLASTMAGLPLEPVAQQVTVTGSVRVERIVIRVPEFTPATSNGSSRMLPRPVEWVEKKANKCVAIDRVAAATIARSDAVDLLLSDGKRLRARLGSECPALDFYSGLYLRPAADGKICADRDWFRSRSGGQCQIESFRSLVPAR